MSKCESSGGKYHYDLYRSGGPGSLSPASASSCLPPTSSIQLLSETDSSLLWAVRLGLGTGLYSLPVAAVTHRHKLRGLKQHTFIILQLWSLKLVSLGQNLDVSRIVFLSGDSTEGSISLPFLVSRGHQHSLVRGPFLRLQSQ